MAVERTELSCVDCNQFVRAQTVDGEQLKRFCGCGEVPIGATPPPSWYDRRKDPGGRKATSTRAPRRQR